MNVDVNYVRWLRAEMKKINDVPISDIKWIEDGVELDIDTKALKRWKFVGLTNCFFIETGAYKEDADDFDEETIKREKVEQDKLLSKLS